MLAFGAWGAASHRPGSSSQISTIVDQEVHSSIISSLRDLPPGNGEYSSEEGVLSLGVIPARGTISLQALGTFEELPLGISLWPPTSIWPSLHNGSISLEHSLLRPTTSYRLELAWLDGRQMHLHFEASPLDEVLDRGPNQERSDPSAPVWARFGADMDRPSVEVSFRMEPPAKGRFEWQDDRVIRFLPEHHLSYGSLHRVTVGGNTKEGRAITPASWSFRPLIPPPLRVTPGDGAPVVFTFDDGTNDMPQAWRLLELLRQYEVKAILLPTGRWARAHPDYIVQALQDGHRICNHSETHARLPLLTDEQMRREILFGAGHGFCDLLRPPSMAISKRVEQMAASLGYKIYLWDVDSRDWEGLYAEDIIHRVLARVKPGAVLLFHMHAPFMLDALPKLFERLRAEGYKLAYEGAPDTPKVMDGDVPDDVGPH